MSRLLIPEPSHKEFLSYAFYLVPHGYILLFLQLYNRVFS